MTQDQPFIPVSCGRCGQLILPRGGRAPRYCAVCGAYLDDRSAPVRHQFRSAERVWPGAIAALVLGLLALVPACGAPLGLAAIVLGLMARRHIERSGGELGGYGLAGAGLLLGVIGMILQTIVCAGIGSRH